MKDSLLLGLAVLSGVLVFLLLSGRSSAGMEAALGQARDQVAALADTASAIRAREHQRRSADSIALAVMADSVEQLQGSRLAAEREGAEARAEAMRLTAELDSATAAIVAPIVSRYESRIRADSVVIVALEGQLELATADAASARSLLAVADSSYAALEAAYDASRGLAALQDEIMAAQAGEIRRLKFATGGSLLAAVGLGVALVVR